MKNLLLVLIALFMGCKSNDEPEANTYNCSHFNNDKEACQRHHEENGSTCQYIDSSHTCQPKKPANICDLDASACKASKICTFDGHTCKMADISVYNKCQAIQEQSPCDADSKCNWNNNSCEDKIAITAKIYSLNKLDKNTTHNIDSDKLHSLVTDTVMGSVFIAGTENAKLRMYRETSKTWRDALDWTQVYDANNYGGARINLSAYKVHYMSPNDDGVIISLNNHGGLILVEHLSNMSYAQNALCGLGNTAELKPYIIKNTVNAFIYTIGGHALAANSVSYRQYTDASSGGDICTGLGTSGTRGNKWDFSLKKSAAANLSHIPTTMTQDNAKNLFLADAEGIKKLDAGDVGQNNKVLANAGNPLVPIADLMLQAGAPNDQGITAMAFIGNYLIVGFKSNAPNNGGIFYKDISTTNPWQKFGQGLGLSVHAISPAYFGPNKGKIAFISSDKGLLIFDNNTLVELIQGKGYLIDHNYINTNRGDKTKDQSGFTGDIWPSTANNIVGAGQAWHNNASIWFIALRGGGADDGGIFTLTLP